MHQILGLRPYFDEKKQKWDKTDNTFFRKRWRFSSIKELFLNLDTYLKPIPKEERWNLYYTVAFCGEGKREFREQNAIVFDVDGIDLTLDLENYISVICSCLGVQRAETGIVLSGNGLHFIIGLTAPIGDPGFFDSTRLHYNAICDKLKLALDKANLPGKPDTGVWDARRIMRLPGTLNKKEGKSDKEARLLQPIIVDREYDVRVISGLPSVDVSEQIIPQTLKKYPIPDTEAILNGCDYLKWCKENPDSVSEGQWYAMLSILPRLPPNGRSLAHEYSANHSGYSEAETESKIDQALAASGPRTCTNFSKLWPGCPKCPNFGKVNSPIMIQGASYILTQDSGFHTVTIDGNGNAKTGKPAYEDLRRYFERKHRYQVLGESGICLTWNDVFWQEYKDKYLENFAQRHFEPSATTVMTQEFKNLVCRTNLKETNWFVDTTHRRVNFKNGILDLDTMALIPHSPEFGFRYATNYDYDPTAKAPEFMKFLLQVMDGRQDLVDVLLEYTGYCFSNDECWAQKALIMTGVGSNGKSTFMDVLKALAGKENYSSLTLADIKVEASRKMLDGKLFNLAEETPSYAMAESTMFKNLVSGGEATVKVLYKQPYTIPIKTKLMFACNDLPKTKDTTQGYFRRLIIVPFDKRFDGAAKDPFIKTKLLKELPGIFNLVIEGYRRLRAQERFTNSKEIDRQIDEYHTDLDSVKSWFQDCVQLPLEPVESPIKPTLSKLYASYKIYAESIGEKPETQATMSRRLVGLLPDYKKRKGQETIAGKRETIFKGIRYSDGSGF